MSAAYQELQGYEGAAHDDHRRLDRHADFWRKLRVGTAVLTVSVAVLYWVPLFWKCFAGAMSAAVVTAEAIWAPGGQVAARFEQAVRMGHRVENARRVLAGWSKGPRRIDAFLDANEQIAGILSEARRDRPSGLQPILPSSQSFERPAILPPREET